jgi:hypothetical protein
LDEPLELLVDGRSGDGVVLKPCAVDDDASAGSPS